jgi:hypothetical protein
MVAKDEKGNKVNVPKLELTSFEEVRRFYDCVRKINHKKQYKELEDKFDHQSKEALELLKNYNIILKIK